MRRPLVAAALLAGLLGVAAQGASTASNEVDDSTAVYRSTTVTGATMRSLSYITTGGSITGFTVTLRGTSLVTAALLPKPVRARFGTGSQVTCTPGALTLLSALTGLREGTWTCLGFSEPAARPQQLTVAVG